MDGGGEVVFDSDFLDCCTDMGIEITQDGAVFKSIHTAHILRGSG